MSAQLLMAIVGIILSLLFSYVPGFANWYNPLDGTKKRLIMVGLLLGTSLAAFGLGCAALFVKIPCTQDGAITLLTAFITALIANQSTNAISPIVGLKAPPEPEELPFQ